MALKCSSAHDVNYHIHALNTHLCLAETEDTWDRISSAIVQLTTLCKNGACDYPDALIAGLRPLSNPITSAMRSERTRLSGIAVDFVSELVAGLGRAFEPFLNTFFPVLLSLCARPNKVVISRTRACILSIIETTQLPAILPLFVQSIRDKSASLRVVAAEGALACLNCFNPPDLEKESRAKDIETLVKATSRDANADVRKLGKKIFEAYKLLLPHRVDSFTAPLTPTIKKYLNVTNNNRPAAAAAIPLQKKVLAASTSAVKSMAPSLASSTTSNPARVLTKSASSVLPTTRPPTRDPASRPPKPISSSNSTKAMPPPSLPVRPTLPAKTVTASLSNLRNVDRGTTAPSRPPMRIERPDPKPTSTTSSAPQRPPIRAPKPPSPTGISFPTGTDADDKVDNTKSHPNLVRAVPEHTRTRSLFGQKPEPPQLGKRPEPKPKIIPAKPVISKTRPEKVNSSSTATKPTSRPRPAAAGSFIPSKSAPELAGKKSESAATKAVATKRMEKAPSKPLWGSGAKKPEPKKVVRPRPESRVESSRSRPVSRVESTRPVSRVESTRPVSRVESTRPVSRVESIRPASRVESVRSRPTSRVESVRSKPESRVPTPASSSAVEDPTADSPAESDERPASSPVESVPEVQASEEVESSEPVVVMESVEVETLGEAPKDEGEQDKEVTVSAEQANNIQIMIAAASPRPMTPSADAERKAWEMKLLEKTPITSLLASIEQGFMFTPSSPLSPPASYLNRGINDTTNFGAPVPVLDLESKKMATKDSATFLFGGGENALSK